LVRRGSVDGGSGRWPPMGAMVVAVVDEVEVVGAVATGALLGA
jgi:hypothetical protein